MVKLLSLPSAFVADDEYARRIYTTSHVQTATVFSRCTREIINNKIDTSKSPPYYVLTLITVIIIVAIIFIITSDFSASDYDDFVPLCRWMSCETTNSLHRPR